MKTLRLLVAVAFVLTLPSCGDETPSAPQQPQPGPTAPAAITLTLTVLNANNIGSQSTPAHPVIKDEVCVRLNIDVDGPPGAGIGQSTANWRGERPNGNTVNFPPFFVEGIPSGGSATVQQCSSFTRNANIGTNGVINRIVMDVSGTDELNNFYELMTTATVSPNDLDNLGQRSCVPDANTLCLLNDRFMATADFATGTTSGQGTVFFSGADDIGSFWFLDPNNEALIVQLIDSCDQFNRFWVFASGATNVEVTLTVTDTLSGQIRDYVNPLMTPFQPIQDTDAFSTCP